MAIMFEKTPVKVLLPAALAVAAVLAGTQAPQHEVRCGKYDHLRPTVEQPVVHTVAPA